jgi:dolichol-phosphate mannosyltransferase
LNKNKLAILIPTYNEAGSISDLLSQLAKFKEQTSVDFDVFVIDDNSPDKTAKRVDEMSLPWVKVISRKKKDGLGAAYREGFRQALATQKYTHIVTMDADGSHQVCDLSTLVTALRTANSPKLVILGTRWIPGGGTINWPIFRIILSKTGTRYAKAALGINLQDLTGGFRIYSSELLNTLNLEEMHSAGYCFQIEMIISAKVAGASFIEVPITFVERTEGKSKMTPWIAIEAFWFVTARGLERLQGKILRR